MCKGNRKWERRADWRGDRETDFKVVVPFKTAAFFFKWHNGLFTDDKHLRVYGVHALIILKRDIYQGLKLINRRCRSLTRNICTKASLTGNMGKNRRTGAGGKGWGEQKWKGREERKVKTKRQRLDFKDQVSWNENKGEEMRRKEERIKYLQQGVLI